ncbi:hypothetical protein HK100_008455 [Physocladia obscura]|uniref:Uncharacterized protein n=1 Tax=Physocladia obscura TaxID=109957 RepID=A0AAD5XEL3_9FUNG|nr:hypothetical protein HK100_008455 [Physocladia obscura]
MNSEEKADFDEELAQVLVGDGLLAGAMTQTALEQRVGRRITEELRSHERAKEEQRREKTVSQLAALIDARERAHNRAGRARDRAGNKAGIAAERAADARIAALQADLDDIDARLAALVDTNGATVSSNSIRANNSTATSYNNATNAGNAGRSVADLTNEMRERSRPQQSHYDRDSDNEVAPESDETEAELEVLPRILSVVDDANEYNYQRRYAAWVENRRRSRLNNSTDIFNEPFTPLPNDLLLSDNFTVPGDVAQKLFPYQLASLSWLKELHTQEAGGILGDEMGLGKTIQIIAFLAGLHRSGFLGDRTQKSDLPAIPVSSPASTSKTSLKQNEPNFNRPILIVAPATVLNQWAKEFHEWWGALRVIILHSSGSGVGSTGKTDSDLKSPSRWKSTGLRNNRRSKNSFDDDEEEDDDDVEEENEDSYYSSSGSNDIDSSSRKRKKISSKSKSAAKSKLKTSQQQREKNKKQKQALRMNENNNSSSRNRDFDSHRKPQEDDDDDSDVADENKRKKFKKLKPKVRKQIAELVDRVVKSGHVLLTTYEGVRVYREILLPVAWAYVVLDEGHKIRNADADITLACKKLRTPHRIILSGTPIQNNLKELWSLYDFVFPGRLGTLPVFLVQFEVPIRLGTYANASNLQVQTAQRCAAILRDLISPYLLRRFKSDVAADLPQKTESVLFCKLTKEQRRLYEDYVHSDIVLGAIDGKRNALGAIDGVRKICNHPDLLHRDTEKQKSNYGDPERSGKMQVLKQILILWKRQGHRALVFCQTRQMQEILELFVKSEGHKYFRMDGTTPIKLRIGMVDSFNADSSITVFLLTTKVGGLGINLTGANRVLIFDPDWNPSTDIQARERAWRLGQTKEVAVYRLMMSGTIEEKIYHRQIYKQFLTNGILSDVSTVGGGVGITGGSGSKRFFDSRGLKDLFVLTDENALGTETGGLFAGSEVIGKDKVDSSISSTFAPRKHSDSSKRAHLNLIPASQIHSGSAAVTGNFANKNVEDDNDGLAGINDIAKIEEFHTPQVETIAESQEPKPASSGELDESRILFSLLHSTVAHDKIMGETAASVDPLTAAQADRVAREAAEEVRLSRKRVRAEQKRAAQAEGGKYAGLVTFTGNSGSAGRHSGTANSFAASSSVTFPTGAARGGSSSINNHRNNSASSSSNSNAIAFHPPASRTTRPSASVQQEAGSTQFFRNNNLRGTIGPSSASLLENLKK